MAKKRKLSSLERLNYHKERVYSPRNYSLESDSGKVGYSDGFVAGFYLRDKTEHGSFWKAKGKFGIYSLGYKRGVIARNKYKL